MQGNQNIDFEISKFKHTMSAHCENGVTSNLLKFNDINLSEAMIFGIGSGLFFSYMPFIKLNGIPVSSYRPLPGAIFKRTARRMGVSVKSAAFRNPEKAMNELNRVLAEGKPVGMVVGVYHLKYFPPAFRFHFNAHNLVAYGRKNGSYIISDPIMETSELLSYEDLKKVRFAKGTAEPKGKMYFVDKILRKPDLKSAIIKGISQTCSHMLTIPIPMFGVKGIRFLAKRMKYWKQKLGDRKAALYMAQLVRMQEEIGTGGAGFRFMYAAFLQESAKILNLPIFNQFSIEMTAVGDRWREFAVLAGRISKNRISTDDSYRNASNLLLEIAGKEEKLFRNLRNVIKSVKS
jgi:hypothetical protein